MELVSVKDMSNNHSVVRIKGQAVKRDYSTAAFREYVLKSSWEQYRNEILKMLRKAYEYRKIDITDEEDLESSVGLTFIDIQITYQNSEFGIGYTSLIHEGSRL